MAFCCVWNGRRQDDIRKRDEVAVAARAGKVDGLTRALPAWLEPIKKLIEARKAGATLEDLREQMLECHPNTQALAGAFAENVETGLRGDSADETVTAQCNQYKHDEGCDKTEYNPTKIIFQNAVRTRKDAKERLKDKGYIGKTITNRKNKNLSTKISGEGLRKLTDSHITKKNLVPAGFTVEEAEEIHMTAVANLLELFEKAEDIDIQPAYHGKGRKTVTHLRTPFSVQSSNKDFIADMPLIQFTDENNGDKLYALHIEIESPDGLRETD